MTVAMEISFYSLLGPVLLLLLSSACWHLRWRHGHRQLYTNIQKTPLSEKKGTFITSSSMKKFVSWTPVFQQGSSWPRVFYQRKGSNGKKDHLGSYWASSTVRCLQWLNKIFLGTRKVKWVECLSLNSKDLGQSSFCSIHNMAPRVGRFALLLTLTIHHSQTTCLTDIL